MNLNDYALLAPYPTPTVNDSRGGRNRTSGRSNPDSKHHDGLTLCDAALMAGWQTPLGNSREAQPKLMHKKRRDGGQPNLAMQAEGCSTSGATSPLSSAETGSGGACRLNPAFSLWLMGFPGEWLHCAVRATQSFRKSPHSSSEPSLMKATEAITRRTTVAKAKTKPAASAPAGSADVRIPPVSDRERNTIGNIGLDQIRPSPLNPRKSFADDSLAALAESIAQQGLLQPLVVRPMGDGKPATFDGSRWKHLSHFELLAGERRFRALALLAESDRLPSDRVPVTVRWLSDAEALSLMIVENEQREDVRPSEQAAGYARLLAESGSVEHVAKTVSQTVAFVRQMIRLTKLPPWALAAVDAGELKRDAAALVARVPGERSRALAAACVLQGTHDPAWLVGTPEHPDLTGDLQTLTFRETKELIRTHFQVELKGAPFDRKALYVLPGCEPGHERNMPACEPCPSRAGNDPEAQAEGVRGDVCLDPECFRAKCEAHKAKEIEKAAKAKVPPAPDGFEWRGPAERIPDGWLDPKVPLAECSDLYDACVFRKGEEVHARKPLAEMLNKLLPQQYLAFDPKGKPRRLVRAKDVRAALGDLGLLKPKGKPAAKVEAGAKASAPSGPGDWEIDERATQLAAKVLAEFAESECEALNPLPDAEMDRPIRDALTYAVRCIGHHALTRCSFTTRRAVAAILAVEEAKAEECVEKAVFDFEPAKLLGLLVAFAAVKELGSNGPERNAGQDLLAWAELDWDQLREQARRELSGGEPAEVKVAKAELREQVAAADKVIDAVFRGTPLANVPDFPASARDYLLLTCAVRYVEQITAKVAEIRAERGRQNATVYDALKAFGVAVEHGLYAAGDALVDHLDPITTPLGGPEGEPGPAKKKGKVPA